MLSGGPAFRQIANTNRALVVLSFVHHIFNLEFSKQDQEALWLTQKNAKTLRAVANLSPAQSIAAHRVKVPATQSSSIAIAVTKSVREISNLAFAETRP